MPALTMLHLSAGMHLGEACSHLLHRLLDFMQIQATGQRQNR